MTIPVCEHCHYIGGLKTENKKGKKLQWRIWVVSIERRQHEKTRYLRILFKFWVLKQLAHVIPPQPEIESVDVLSQFGTYVSLLITSSFPLKLRDN